MSGRMDKKPTNKLYRVSQTFECPFENNAVYPEGRIVDLSSWNVLDVQNALGGFLITEYVGAEPTQEDLPFEEVLADDTN